MSAAKSNSHRYRFETIPDIVNHIRGKFPAMIFIGADYSIADLIADLERIEAKREPRDMPDKA